MLPEEMMKPKNKCQREEGRRGGVGGGEVKLCQSLAASDGSGNKRINEGMKEENAAWRRRGGERRPAGRDAEGAQAARWRDERHVSGVPLLHLSIPPSLPHPSPPSFFCAVSPFLEKPETLHPANERRGGTRGHGGVPVLPLGGRCRPSVTRWLIRSDPASAEDYQSKQMVSGQS